MITLLVTKSFLGNWERIHTYCLMIGTNRKITIHLIRSLLNWCTPDDSINSSWNFRIWSVSYEQLIILVDVIHNIDDGPPHVRCTFHWQGRTTWKCRGWPPTMLPSPQRCSMVCNPVICCRAPPVWPRGTIIWLTIPTWCTTLWWVLSWMPLPTSTDAAGSALSTTSPLHLLRDQMCPSSSPLLVGHLPCMIIMPSASHVLLEWSARQFYTSIITSGDFLRHNSGTMSVSNFWMSRILWLWCS